MSKPMGRQGQESSSSLPLNPRLAETIEAVKAYMTPHPFCTDNFEFGVYRLPQEIAWTKANIELNWNDSCMVLLFDVDREGAAVAWDDANLPPPTWIAKNPKNAHAHLAYVLEQPVTRLREYQSRPIQFLRLIRAAMSSALNADLAYSGKLTKNPLSSRWTVWGTGKRYSLNELAEYLPEELIAQTKRQASESRDGEPDGYGLSRKVTLFTDLRRFGYQHWCAIADEVAACGRSSTLRDAAAKMNVGIGRKGPLSPKSLESAVWRVERWLSQRYCDGGGPQFSKRQALRQARGARVKRDRRERQIAGAIETLRSEGKRVSKSAVAKLVGCHRSSITRYYPDAVQEVLP